MKSLFSRSEKSKKSVATQPSNKQEKKSDNLPRHSTERSNRAKSRRSSERQSAHILHEKFAINATRYQITSKDFPKSALSIVEKLHKAGYEAYMVGGCIRDLLLGKKPKDFDIATNARPEEVQKIFGRQCRLVGRRFRLAHIVFGREIFEVATFRAAHDNHNNEKLSKVSEAGMLLRDNVYGTMREDAERRDFSINAFYYDPRHNVIYDFFNGIADLNAGKLRLLGDPVQRYQEDPVRMLRAIRFMAKLEMFLDQETAAPIKKMAHLLKLIPAARLFDESLKLLQSGAGLKTYHLLREYELFELLFPILTPFFTAKQDSNAERMIIKALTSTDERIRDRLPVNPAFLFAVLFWYPLREKIDELKNEGGLNNHDSMMLAGNDILDESCKAIALHRRHTGIIREIWALQFQMMRRTGNRPLQTLEAQKFRAGFDLLVMRAEIEGGDLVELSAWWHEFQFSNEAQRAEMLQAVKKLPQYAKFATEEKKKRRRKPHFRRKKQTAKVEN